MNNSINTKNSFIYFIVIILLSLLTTLNHFKVTPGYAKTLSNLYTEAPTNNDIKDTVISNRQSKTIGFIKAINNENGVVKLTIDPVEFYIFDEAKAERAKDGLESSVVPYYIRNINTDLITYTLSKDASTNLCIYLVADTYENASINVPVTLDQYVDYVNKNLNNNERALLFWLDIKENNIIRTEMQFTP